MDTRLVLIAGLSFVSITILPSMISNANSQLSEMQNNDNKNKGYSQSNSDWSAQKISDTGMQYYYNFILKPSPNPVIQAYVSKTSVYPGEELGFYVNSTESYTVKIYRIGWYGNDSNVRLVYFNPELQKPVKQPRPYYDATTNFVDPRWYKSFSIHISYNWTTGVYFAELVTKKGDITYSLFVVKNPKNEGDVIVKLPVNTYQAYNSWAGKSLYEHLSDNRKTVSIIRTTNAAYKVTFERPYAEDNGMGQFLKFDLPLVRFLERNRYDVSYITDIDLHSNQNILNGYKVFISSGHDEYWSHQMRKNLEQARDRGLDIIFSGGNDVYWQVRFEKSPEGKDNSVMVCYKKRYVDPFDGKNDTLVTTMWRADPVNLPENSLVGTLTNETWFTRGALTITNSSSWVYSGTDFKDGDKVPGIIGYEVQSFIKNGFEPKNVTTLGHSFAKNDKGESTFVSTILYTTNSGSIVFSAGSVLWNWGLDDWLYYYPRLICNNPCKGLDDWLYYYPNVNSFSDPQLQSMMRNIIHKMIESS